MKQINYNTEKRIILLIKIYLCYTFPKRKIQNLFFVLGILQNVNSFYN